MLKGNLFDITQENHYVDKRSAHLVPDGFCDFVSRPGSSQANCKTIMNLKRSRLFSPGQITRRAMANIVGVFLKQGGREP
jgi:hypothetical protein